MSAPIGARQDGNFKAVSTAPSINQTPVGSAMVPLPYQTVSDLSRSVGVAKSVRFNGKPVYTMGSSQPDCKGDEHGSGGGIRSGTVNGEVKPTGASRTVKVEGKCVVRHGDPCTMNGGNNLGVYVTVPAASAAAPATAAATSNPPVQLQTKEEESAFLSWLHGLQQDVRQAGRDPWEGAKGMLKGILNLPSNAVELLMNAAAEQHATELSDAALTATIFGQDGAAWNLDEVAAASRQQAARIDVPKFGMSNPAQRGGDIIVTAVQLFAGGVGVARGGIKAVAEMGKIYATRATAAGVNAADKVAAVTVNSGPSAKTVEMLPNDGMSISGATNTDNLIAQRVAANTRLRNSPRFAEDMKKAGVNDDQISKMFAKKAPLGFKSEEQFEQFRAELRIALSEAGLSDAKIGLKGTSTTFYSENPGKPLGHFWDADLANPGDYDLNIYSPTMAKNFENSNIKIDDKYKIFKTRTINRTYPALDNFQRQWSDTLGRTVNFVGYDGPPKRDPTEYILGY